jgi:hypothetical protein
MTEAEFIAKVRELARTLPASDVRSELRLIIGYDKKTGQPRELTTQETRRYAILAPTAE